MTLSILGLIRARPDVLDGLQLPDGIDRETLQQNLILEAAELEIIYPDPDFLAAAVRAWSAKQLPVWEKLLATTRLKYNPIWNVDGTETETEEHNLTVTAESTGTSTDSVKGYNEETSWKDHDRNQNSGNGTTHDNGTITRTKTRGGNIGVTTTQAMIREERDIVQFTVQDYIISDFKQRFCLLVY